MKYVCGFLFDSTLQNVALILKNRGPANMAGHLNGIGGKIERGESPRSAQSREFFEETGVMVPLHDWNCFHTERYYTDTTQDRPTDPVVYFMAAKSLDAHLVRTMEDEMVELYGAVPELLSLSVDKYGLPEYLRGEVAPPMYNLGYLIPMALCWLARPLDRYMES